VLALVLSGAAIAAPTGPAKLTGADGFNHMSTGFPLYGMHATTACEACHVGGVFKGTPRNCDGCHAVGKRVVAIPKLSNHIITDAPCESCHFNTSTFLGARFNHATATPDQCQTCHNGRIALGKPASHNSGSKATASCDRCHRTSAFLPASWNHNGVVPGTCTTCHNGSAAIGKPGSHTTVAKATFQCDDCHSFLGWIPAKYKHNTPGVCASCHNGSIAIGKTSTHTGAKGTLACDDCHSVNGWLPAAYTHRGVVPGSCATCHNGSAATGKTSTHTGLKGTLACDDCHSVNGWVPAAYTHRGVVTGSCATCHNGSAATGKTSTHTGLKGSLSCDGCHRTTSWLPASYNHIGAGACSSCHNGTSATGKPGNHIVTTDECNQCHSSTKTWAGALGSKPANHIPYNSGTLCSSCHVGGSVVTGAALHAYVSATCKTCHDNNSPSYLGVTGKKTLGSHEGSKTSQDCISCHARQYSSWNEP